jgi:hypothetical protein
MDSNEHKVTVEANGSVGQLKMQIEEVRKAVFKIFILMFNFLIASSNSSTEIKTDFPRQTTKRRH